MPKLKTHRGTAKRIKVTGSGKLMRQRAFGSHLLQKKGSARKRVIAQYAAFKGATLDNIKRALGV